MTKTTALPTPKAGAGVLNLLHLFRQDGATADGYAAACLEKTKGVEPRLKAFEYLPVDIKRRPGPLSGIPVAIKDIIATSDMPTTNGSPIYRDHIPAADAWVVERLRQLGATIFGKTVSTEFAWRHPGPTVNPWNSDHTPGGSSSGSAASVAAGLVPLALGSQTLGSVIRPAAFNGIVGLKPSFGAIPRAGVHPLSPSLDHVGFFARRVDDVALALSLLAGPSDADRHGRPLPAFQVDLETGLTPLERPRLGIVRFQKYARAEPAQQKVFEAAITRAREAGAVVEELPLAEFDAENWPAINTILSSEGAAIFGGLVTRYPDRTSDVLWHGRPLPAFHVDPETGLSPLERPRLGIVRFRKFARAEPAQQKVFEAAITRAREAGAVVEELPLAEFDAENWPAINTILSSEGAAIFGGLVSRYPDRTSDVLKAQVERGKTVSAIDYLAAKAMQEKWRMALPKEMSGFDALLTLPAFGEAPRGLDSTGDAEYCAPWTFIGAPAVNLPAGFGPNGLPLGIQLVGRYREDLRVLRVAKWMEATLGFDPGIPKIMS